MDTRRPELPDDQESAGLFDDHDSSRWANAIEDRAGYRHQRHSDANGGVVSGETIYWTTTNSDGLGRTVSVVLPDNNQTQYSYAIENDTVNGAAWLGTQTTITDPMNKQKRYLYDAFGNLLRVDEPNASNTLIETARYTYDVAGRMTQSAMRKNDGSYTQTRTFVYSAYSSSAPWGLLSSSTTPEKGTVNYFYNSNGMLDHKIDAKNQTLWYAYDANHRLLTISSGASQSSAYLKTSFTYDTGTNGVGKMATAFQAVSNCNGQCTGYTLSYAYDAMGRMSAQTLATPYYDPNNGSCYPSQCPLGASATFGYDSDGKLTAMAHDSSMGSGGQAAFYQYTYDAVGRATGLQQWDVYNQVWNPLTSGGSYNAAGQITGWAEGVYNLTRSYDPARGWMTGLNASYWAGATLNMQYGYNADGQATTVTDTVNPGQSVTSYAYDNLNRLASATTPNWSMAWTYDEFGNRLTQTGTGTAASLTQTQTYDPASNRLTNHTYDANGNMTDGVYGHVYDVFDRLYGTGYGPTISYDAFGHRVAKASYDGTTVRIFLNDPSGRVLTYWDVALNTSYYNLAQSTPVAPVQTYRYFAGQRVGQWTDRGGSLRSSGGASATNAHYYPYGEEITTTANDGYKFAQTYRDSDSGLDYANARYYASGVGRFLTGDARMRGNPSRPQSLNNYAYTESNPVNGIDPGGKWTCTLDGAWFDCSDLCSASGEAFLASSPDPLPNICSGGTNYANVERRDQDEDCNAITTQMPASGSGFYEYGPGFMRYGTPGVIAVVEIIASNWNQSHPDIQIGIGDISLENGGVTKRHGSHRLGVDVDFRPLRKDGKPLPTNINDPSYSSDQTAQLISMFSYLNAFLKQVDKIFFNDSAISASNPLVSPLDGHDNHFHVRFNDRVSCDYP